MPLVDRRGNCDSTTCTYLKGITIHWMKPNGLKLGKLQLAWNFKSSIGMRERGHGAVGRQHLGNERDTVNNKRSLRRWVVFAGDEG